MHTPTADLEAAPHPAPDDLAIAWQHARGETAPTILNGRIVRTGPDVNVGWSWHLDSDDFELAEVTPEGR